MKYLLILFLILGCGENNRGMLVIERNDLTNSACLNGWSYTTIGTTWVTLYDKEGKPIPCSMEVVK